MRLVASNSLEHLRDSVFFDGPNGRQKQSRFWILLVLAAIIAAAGVVGDSTATVIGAMIVAPLMTPIMGTMLAVVLADRRNLFRSLTFVAGGALTAIAIGYLLGLLSVNPVDAATNSQVAARVDPRLIDLLAALATGVVGSVALVRSDISDTLPGVAIAISLVPPLSVVGLTLESGEYHEAAGALLLFMTNVTAILAIGTIVMALYGVHRMVVLTPGSVEGRVNRRRALIVIAIMMLIVVVPLTGASVKVVEQRSSEANARSAATEFGHSVGWAVVNVETIKGVINIEMEGPLPLPETDPLRDELTAKGVDPSDVRVELSPVEVVEFP